MVVKINRKPIKVDEDEGMEVDKAYLATSCLGYLLIFWIMDFAGQHLLGISPFPWTHFVTWIINGIGWCMQWFS
jgi:hypothetical protein